MRKTTAEYFWSHVEIRGSCWEWTGSTDGAGYGKATDTGRRSAMAHRLSWKLMYGPIPTGLLVMHACDNRPCVRPSHLSLGTQAENMRDMVSKGRHRGAPPRHYGPPKPKRSYRRTIHPIPIDLRLRIIESRHEGLLQREIGARYGLTQAAVSQVLTAAGYRCFRRKAS